MRLAPGPHNLITDVAGLGVGQVTDTTHATGVSVVLGEAPMVAGVHVMGGAPGTRETDLLRPEALVEGVDALVLSGGSAFGLGAADGVAGALRRQGRGFEVAGQRVPIVPAAILFDLTTGEGWSDSPYPALGTAALEAVGSDIVLGSVGAGTGAVAGPLKGGTGSASAVLEDGTMIGALVAANPVGGTCDPETGRFWAAPFEEADEFGGHGTAPRAVPQTKIPLAGANTTIAVVATDATLTKAQATRMATAAQDGMARAILPSHTPYDGDLIFAAATGHRPAPDPAGLALIGHAAATCLARAIARAVHAARPVPGVAVPCWHERYPVSSARTSR